MCHRIVALMCLAFVASARADEPLPVTTIPVANIQKHIETLASPEFEGRGTPAGRKKAQAYLLEQFREIGLKPLFGQSFTQDVPGPQLDEGAAPFDGLNIGGCIPGSDPKLRDEWVILAAHYDHLGVRQNKIYPGADDNASSVAMMLEVARQLASSPTRPQRSVAIISFDLEERLLWGSRWFAAHPPMKLDSVKLFITAEMIGRRLGDLPLPIVFVMGAEHATGLHDLVEAVPVPKGLETAYLGADLVGSRSDYAPFRDQQVPFLFFSGGEHPDYHQPTDTADRIDHDRVARVSDVVLGVMRKAITSDPLPAWTDDPQHGLEEIHVLKRITTTLLAEDDAARNKGAARLTAVQRLLVANVHARVQQVLDRGTVDPAERPTLIRFAQALLLTVF